MSGPFLSSCIFTPSELIHPELLTLVHSAAAQHKISEKLWSYISVAYTRKLKFSKTHKYFTHQRYMKTALSMSLDRI